MIQKKGKMNKPFILRTLLGIAAGVIFGIATAIPFHSTVVAGFAGSIFCGIFRNIFDRYGLFEQN